jgi:hypothetical protein
MKVESIKTKKPNPKRVPAPTPPHNVSLHKEKPNLTILHKGNKISLIV